MAQTVSNTLHSPLSLTAASQNPLLIQGIGGIVLNSGSATSAIYGDASQAWIVVNEGIVAVADTFSYGIDLAAGGYVGNYQKYGGSALISAGTGVYMGGPGTVRNFSSITGVTGYGVSVVAGYVVNLESFANISGKRGGVLMSFNDSTVGNDGTIAGTGTAGIGVSFLRGGTLINLGTISGAGAAAQFAGTYASRLILYPGAAFENGSGGPGRVSASTTGGGSSNALELANGRGETGTITGLGSLFTGFYAVTVGAGASWVISGQNTIGTGVPTLALTVYGALTNQSNFVASGFDGAIDLDGGSLLNAALATLGGIGGFAVIGQSSAATVVNLGTMYRNIGDGYAVSLTAGGAMTNGSATNSTAAITGGAGAYLALAGTVTNYGTIAGFGPGNSLSAGSGIEFHAGGSLINGSAPGAVASIYGTATGVFAPGAAPLAISNYGAITGRHTGIVLGGDATLTNAGRISGGNGTAVVLGGSAANRLIVSPFGSFGGIVTGSTTAGASNTLELASATVAGILSGLGTSFTGFQDVTVDAGAAWTLAGTNSLANGVTLADAGSLTNSGSLAGGIALAAGAVLTNATTGVVGYAGTAIAADGSAGITNFGTLQGGGASGLGVFLPAGGTLTNGGAVIGNSGTAVLFGGTGDNRVVLLPGASFTGTVVGSPTLAAANTLELASGLRVGTVSGIGTAFRNFQSGVIDVGAYWVALGGNTLGGAGTFTNAGNLAVQAGSFADPGSVVNNGILQFDTATALLGNVGGSGSATLAGATLTLQGSVIAAQTIGFAGTGNHLVLASPASMGATLQGFTSGDVIDFANIPHSGTDHAGLLPGNLLRVTFASGTVDLQMATGDSFVGTFTLASDGAVGSDLTLVACFAAGTRLLTRHGERAIEALRAGDKVWTRSGNRFAPIIWIGHRRLDIGNHPRPETLWPVRIRAHAFAPQVPHRDLILSPDHAVLMAHPDGEVLVPVRLLVNGTSIRHERVATVTYWHIELPAHAIVLAEGLPAESYLDTGNRGAFEGAPAHAMAACSPAGRNAPARSAPAAPSVLRNGRETTRRGDVGRESVPISAATRAPFRSSLQDKRSLRT